MRYSSKPRGVCPMRVDFDLNGDIVTNIKFYGGCDGNLKAIAKLVDGMTVAQINEKLAGTTCGKKSSSCSDQLVVAINNAVKERK